MSTLLKLGASAALGYLTAHTIARRTIRHLQHNLHAVERIASRDRLTGLPNRYQAGKHFLLRDLRGLPALIVLVDLDQFKGVNDLYGHHVGDQLLTTIAHRLRDAATAHRGTAARLAGDEFLLMLPPTGHDPVAVVEHILFTIGAPVWLDTDDGPTTIEPTATAGLTIHHSAEADLESLLHEADIALYHAKQHPGTACAYTDGMAMPRTGRHGPRRRDTRHETGTSEAGR